MPPMKETSLRPVVGSPRPRDRMISALVVEPQADLAPGADARPFSAAFARVVWACPQGNRRSNAARRSGCAQGTLLHPPLDASGARHPCVDPAPRATIASGARYVADTRPVWSASSWRRASTALRTVIGHQRLPPVAVEITSASSAWPMRSYESPCSRIASIRAITTGTASRRRRPWRLALLCVEVAHARRLARRSSMGDHRDAQMTASPLSVVVSSNTKIYDHDLPAAAGCVLAQRGIALALRAEPVGSAATMRPPALPPSIASSAARRPGRDLARLPPETAASSYHVPIGVALPAAYSVIVERHAESRRTPSCPVSASTCPDRRGCARLLGRSCLARCLADP